MLFTRKAAYRRGCTRGTDEPFGYDRRDRLYCDHQNASTDQTHIPHPPRMAIHVFSQEHFERAQHTPTVVCWGDIRGDAPNACTPGEWYGSRATAHRSVPRPTSAHRESLC